MARKIKTAPSWLENKTLVRIYQSRIVVILSNWLFQGTRIMLPVERCLKVILEAAYSVLYFFLFSLTDLNGVALLMVSVISAHTSNWLTNGHFFVLMRYCYDRKIKYQKFISFPNSMLRRLSGWEAVIGVVAFGSLSRRMIHSVSDLDVRIITEDTLRHQWIGALLVWRERLLAFLAGYPLDIYLATLSRGLEKLRVDEPPVIILDPTGIIAKTYPKTFFFKDIV